MYAIRNEKAVRNITVFSSEYVGYDDQTNVKGFIIMVLETIPLSSLGTQLSLVDGREEGTKGGKGRDCGSERDRLKSINESCSF